MKQENTEKDSKQGWLHETAFHFGACRPGLYIPLSSFPILTAHFITTYSAFIFMPEAAQQVAVGP